MAMPDEEREIRHLDPKVRILWSLGAVGVAALVWIILVAITPAAFPEGIFGFQPPLYALIFLLAVAVFLIPYLAWVELEYRSYKYYMTQTELVIGKGILRVERIVIPFEKVQNVNASRSLLERILDLATLKIETAGTTPGEAEGMLPGVSRYKDIIEEMLERVEHTRAARQPQKVEEKAEKTETSEHLLEEIAALRREIQMLRDEKKAEEAKPPQPSAPILEFESERYKKPSNNIISPKKATKKAIRRKKKR